MINPCLQSLFSTFLPYYVLPCCFIKTVTSSKTGQRVNADEAMALGAAYIAANHSSIFRTKTLFFNDVSTHSYSINILPLPLSANDSSTTQTPDSPNLQLFRLESLSSFPPPSSYVREIIPIGSRLAGTRTTTFKANRDMGIKLYEDGHLLTSYNIVGVEETYRSFLHTFTPDVGAQLHWCKDVFNYSVSTQEKMV